ncbi:beta carbonic anhydrase 5, chloroplastic-like isoform X1 [Actinidia eriantha]|uniref:beta carbonic anhydrase 5, chloroplastic-like isoform X1 n=1 Tax=Actinidia eriantha TaxID=165200 RepID=UPI00258AA6B5|nr:beta carbonic anhydrase 5, chloroplastic-like isoform X1 [Actinidia eriantha]
MAQAVLGSSSLSLLHSKLSSIRTSDSASTIFGSQLKSGEIEKTHLRLLVSFRSNPALSLKALRESPELTQELTNNKPKSIEETQDGSNLFNEMKHRFLNFKKRKFLENSKHFQNLAMGQAPKFMVISCADSRVCPSNILGFQPGEAFVVRNVANLVPTYESGPSETNAALEFAVTSAEVENILVIGHSCCGGIRALMSMQDEVNTSSFISSWVLVGKNARLSTKAAASNLSLDQQCRHCEKESINRSLLNLLTYPWIQERVTKGVLSIHGGYYNFVDCTFEKWTLDYHQEGSSREENGKYKLKNREFWC